MKRFILLVFVVLALAGVTYAAEVRQLGPYNDNGYVSVAGDLRLGNTCTTSTGLRYYCGLNASHIGFLADNTLRLEILYRLALAADNGVLNYVLTSNGDNTFRWASAGEASMVYPGAGIAVSTGAAWGTSLTAPSGTIVGTTDSQQLSNKTFGSGMTWPTFDQNTTGNAATATALASNPANCSAGQAPLGIDNTGAVESCWTPGTGDTVTTLPWDNITSKPAALITGATANRGLVATDNTLGLIESCGPNEILKWNGSVWACAADSQSAGSNPGFDNVQSGSNTSATMTVGTGASLAPVDGGTITASNLSGAYIDWAAPIGTGPYVANKPTIQGQEIVGNVLDNALVYPPMTAIALTSQYIDWSADEGGTSVSNRPTINSVTVTGAVLDNVLNYPATLLRTNGSAAALTSFPTLNQNTSGTAAGLTAQYVDWSLSSGGASVANRPTINGSAVTGTRLDNAANYPTFNQNTSGTAAALTSDPSDCSAGQYATGIAANGNLTCGTPAGSGDMNDLSDDTSPSLGGNLDGMGFTIDNVSQLNFAQGATGGEVLLYEGTGGGSEYTGWKAGDAFGASYVMRIPLATPASDFMRCDAPTDNVSLCEWVDLGTLAVLDNSTLTESKYCTWTASGLECNSEGGVGIGTVTEVSADNVAELSVVTGTSTPIITIVGVPYTKLLGDAPTWNQNTSGTAAGLAAQYIDWNQESGATSIANKPTLGTIVTLNQGTMTDNTYCKFDTEDGVVCNYSAVAGNPFDQDLNTNDNAVFNSVSTGTSASTAGFVEMFEKSGTGGESVKITAADSLTDNVTITVSSTSVDFGALNFVTTGAISGAIPVLDNVANPTAAQMYGSNNVVNAAITVLLPTAVGGMSGCITDGAAAATDIIVDVQAGDNVVLTGVVQDGGVGITNASGSSLGDYVCFIATAANKWRVYGKVGTWVSQ